ncbi:MAG: hypothetical protein IJE05_00890 [Clostridia bacterium]|nr:hypothetical protein [Clostridia bacterium]
MENIFDIKYNDELDKLELPIEKKEKNIFNFLLNHKFFSIVLISFFALSGINFYLIYSFMKILENV